MSKLDIGATGLALNISADDTYLDEAAELEDLGYSTFWIPGGQLDGLDRIAQLVRGTKSAVIAPSILSLDLYSADAVAALYAELQDSDPGRFLVGLGGPQKARPLPALNAFLDTLDHAEPPVPVEHRILAALGPRKLELARDRTAGAVPLLVTPAFTADARRILGPEATLVIQQMVVLDTDAERARETARGPLRFLSQVGGYRSNFQRMGFTEDEIAELSDRLVDELVVCGDAEAIAVRVAAHRAAGADQVALSVRADGDQPGPIEVARQLADTLMY